MSGVILSHYYRHCLTQVSDILQDFRCSIEVLCYYVIRLKIEVTSSHAVLHLSQPSLKTEFDILSNTAAINFCIRC